MVRFWREGRKGIAKQQQEAIKIKTMKEKGVEKEKTMVKM